MRRVSFAGTFAVVGAGVLRAAAGAAQTPPARLVSVHDAVEVSMPARHAGAAGEPLVVGARVHVGEHGAAVIAVGEATRLRLEGGTSVVMFAPAQPPPAGTPLSDDTSLQRGTVRSSVADPASGGAPPARSLVALATPGARVTFPPGEAVVVVDAARNTRVMAQRGTVRVRIGGRQTTVRAGFGMRVPPRGAAPAPAPLPAPPAWTGDPPRSVISTGVAQDLTLPYGLAAPAGRGRHPRPAATPAAPVVRWHQQVARDARFEDTVVDREVPVGEQRLELHGLTAGTYFMRVAAVDRDRMEGMFGLVASVQIAAPRIVSGGDGRRATVEMPAGFYCGLDGAPLAPLRSAIQLSPGRNHQLRCAATADGGGAVDVPITAAQSGPLVHRVRIEPAGFTPGGGQRTVVLQLADGAGLPLAYASVTGSATEGATLHALRETDVRGTYTGTLHWRAGAAALRLHFVVNGADEFDFDVGH